jgi:nitric oxide reductase large subunit
MDKQKLFKIMSISSDYGSNNIKVIELISGLVGIWHYYIFTGETLSQIAIKTDYY